MDLVLDFRRSGGAASMALEQMRELLACYQFVLGHELPNRLVVMQGLARMLIEQNGTELDAEGRLLLDRLANSARGAHEMALRLAAVGGLCRDIESEQGQGSAALGEVVREAVAEVKLLFGGRAIEFQLQERMPALLVDRRALHQALVHLLRNAVQAGKNARPVRIEVGASARIDGVEVWVRDNGRGLSEEQGRRAFRGFSPGGGTGLGLFLVRQAVACWGGALRVRSELEEGTTVTLVLPLQRMKDEGGRMK